MKTLTVSLGDRSYEIHIGAGMLEQIAEKFPLRDYGAVAVVSDQNVAPLYGDKLAETVAAKMQKKPAMCVMSAGEKNKRLDRIEWLCGEFLQAGLDRSSLVIALGGGVVGDMAGFAASIFMRGIPFVQVPTTLLAQVDSSVGGKTGVNHPLGKNTIGAFHQPAAVFIDLQTLQTLPDRELSAGLAEVVKHGIIADPPLFDYMLAQASRLLKKDEEALEWPIVRSCEIKSDIVAADEREQGVRAHLNYGHTFGHAIEAVTEYRQFLHGEALALGMQAAAHIAVHMGLVGEDLLTRQRQCLAKCRLPVSWPEIPVEETLALMKHDKKWRAGKAVFVLPDRLGHVVRRSDVPEALVRAALHFLKL